MTQLHPRDIRMLQVIVSIYRPRSSDASTAHFGVLTVSINNQIQKVVVLFLSSISVPLVENFPTNSR